MLDPLWSYFLQESILQSAIYCALCFILHYFWALFSGILIGGFNDLSEEVRTTWHNKGVSTVHAIIMFTLACYYWKTINPYMIIESSVSTFEARMLDIMLGYLYYDTVLELWASCSPDILIHHGIVLVSRDV